MRRPLLALVLGLPAAACSSTIEVGIPADYAGPRAVVEEGGAANVFRFATEAEAFFDILAVDGSADAGTYVLVPGRHRFTVDTHHDGRRFRGDVSLIAPAGESVLLARRRRDDFDVVLLRCSDRRELGRQRVHATEIDSLHWLPLLPLSLPIH